MPQANQLVGSESLNSGGVFFGYFLLPKQKKVTNEISGNHADPGLEYQEAPWMSHYKESKTLIHSRPHL